MKKGGRGKEFEGAIRDAFEKVPNVSVTRLKDDVLGYKDAKNPCDFIVYHKPYLYAIECKSVLHGNILSIYSTDPDKCYGAITNGQWDGLLEMSTVTGVFAGIVCWWVDKDVTRFIPIQMLKAYRDCGHKSIRFDVDMFTDDESIYQTIEIYGRKKRIYYDYDMQQFLKDMEGTE